MKIAHAALLQLIEREPERILGSELQVDSIPRVARTELAPVASVPHLLQRLQAGGAVGRPERQEPELTQPVVGEDVVDHPFEAVVARFADDAIADTEDIEPGGSIHELDLGGVDLTVLDLLATLAAEDAEGQLEFDLDVAGVDHLQVAIPAKPTVPGLDDRPTKVLMNPTDGGADFSRRKTGPLGNTPAEDAIFDHVHGLHARAGRHPHTVVHLIQARVPAPEPGFEALDAFELEFAVPDTFAVGREQGADATEPDRVLRSEGADVAPGEQHLAVLRPERTTERSVVLFLHRNGGQVQDRAHVVQNPAAHVASLRWAFALL